MFADASFKIKALGCFRTIGVILNPNPIRLCNLLKPYYCSSDWRVFLLRKLSLLDNVWRRDSIHKAPVATVHRWAGFVCSPLNNLWRRDSIHRSLVATIQRWACSVCGGRGQCVMAWFSPQNPGGYSTEVGVLCVRCLQPIGQCVMTWFYPQGPSGYSTEMGGVCMQSIEQCVMTWFYPQGPSGYSTEVGVLSARWAGFADPHSGLDYFRVGLGSSPGDTDVVPFVFVGRQTGEWGRQLGEWVGQSLLVMGSSRTLIVSIHTMFFSEVSEVLWWI